MGGSLIGLGQFKIPGIDPRAPGVRGETPEFPRRKKTLPPGVRAPGVAGRPRPMPSFPLPPRPRRWNPWADLRAQQQRIEAEQWREGTLGGTPDDAIICAQGLGQTADPLATILGTAITAGGQIGAGILTADAQKAAMDEQIKAQEASAAAAAKSALDQANLTLEARGQDEQLQAARSAQIASVAKTAVVAVAGLALVGIGLKLAFGRKKV